MWRKINKIFIDQFDNSQYLKNKMDTLKIKVDMALESIAKLETCFTDLENVVEYIEGNIRSKS